MKLTSIDIQIMNRFDWVPYDTEHQQPSYASKIKEYALSYRLAATHHRFPLVHASILLHHIERDI